MKINFPDILSALRVSGVSSLGFDLTTEEKKKTEKKERQKAEEEEIPVSQVDSSDYREPKLLYTASKGGGITRRGAKENTYSRRKEGEKKIVFQNDRYPRQLPYRMSHVPLQVAPSSWKNYLATIGPPRETTGRHALDLNVCVCM